MICIDCRKAGSQTVEGMTMCLDCLQAERERLQRAPQEIANWERFRKLAAGGV